MGKISTLNYIIEKNQNDESYEQNLSAELFLIDNDELYEPAPSSIQAILNFARSYEVVKSKNAGNIELNLN